MNAKISVFVICVEAIICLLLHNLHDCTFKIFIMGTYCRIVQNVMYLEPSPTSTFELFKENS